MSLFIKACIYKAENLQKKAPSFPMEPKKVLVEKTTKQYKFLLKEHSLDPFISCGESGYFDLNEFISNLN